MNIGFLQFSLNGGVTSFVVYSNLCLKFRINWSSVLLKYILQNRMLKIANAGRIILYLLKQVIHCILFFLSFCTHQLHFDLFHLFTKAF